MIISSMQSINKYKIIYRSARPVDTVLTKSPPTINAGVDYTLKGQRLS
jgi:hypothetical protein